MNREVHICTVCRQEMKATDALTTLYEVTYHARCTAGVHASEVEAARDRQTTDN
jgi:hypothetical protein